MRLRPEPRPHQFEMAGSICFAVAIQPACYYKLRIYQSNEITMKTIAPNSETTSTSRRDFLKTSATVAGTALIGALDVGRFAHAAGQVNPVARLCY